MGTLYKPLYTEIRDTDDRYYHPLIDDWAKSKVRMWYVRGELRAGDIRLALWHHTVLPATRAHDPTLNVGLQPVAKRCYYNNGKSGLQCDGHWMVDGGQQAV